MRHVAQIIDQKYGKAKLLKAQLSFVSNLYPFNLAF